MKHKYIKEQFQNIDIELSEEQIEQFITYYEMLVERNKVVNLTAITEFEDVVIKHFVDSVLAYKNEIIGKKLKEPTVSVIDIGTGAGFPGIPLKIVFPNIKLTLLDSLNKRIIFLQDVIQALELEHVECIHGRAEDFGMNPKYREKYDIVVSRAVSNLSTLSEYCVPFIKINGLFVSYKSMSAEEEIKQAANALKILNCELNQVSDFELSSKDEDYVRKFVIISKKGKLNKKYPRKAGMPSRNPL